MTAKMAGKIAVVTGASRGVGRGIAIALGEVGATVYLTGTTSGEGERTIEATARAVDEAGAAATRLPVATGSPVPATGPIPARMTGYSMPTRSQNSVERMGRFIGKNLLLEWGE